MPDTLKIAALSASLVRVKYDDHEINRVRIRGSVFLIVDNDRRVTQRHKLWETYLRRTDRTDLELPMKTKEAARALAEKAVVDWVATPDGLYDLYAAELRSREDDVRAAQRKTAEAAANLKSCHEEEKQAQAARREAAKVLRKLWDSQVAKGERSNVTS